MRSGPVVEAVPADRSAHGGDEVVRTADLLRALADPLRRRMLRLLAEREETARSAMREELALPSTALTYHVRILLDAGLIRVRKDGRSHHYALRRDPLLRLRKELTGLARETSRGG